jgi:hypothetical protein
MNLYFQIRVSILENKEYGSQKIYKEELNSFSHCSCNDNGTC